MKINPHIIIGLGNPGKEYEKTYHNVGFLAVDHLAESSQISNLLKSDVFMNQSGDFVKRSLKKYKIKPEELLIIHDDNDIELGKYKISYAKNSAGHKGVDSIIKSLKTKNFWRIRIGIGKAGLPAEAQRAKAGDLVLKKISQTDLKILSDLFENLKFSHLCQK